MFLEVTLQGVLLTENVCILVVDGALLVSDIIESFIIMVVEGVVAVVRLLLSRAEAKHRAHAEHLRQRRDEARSLHFDGFCVPCVAPTSASHSAALQLPCHHQLKMAAVLANTPHTNTRVTMLVLKE